MRYFGLAALALFSEARASESEPRYRWVLEMLRSLDEPVPDTPPVHPVSTVYNREAIVPPQCYTQTKGFYNPCYVCHQDGINGRENVMNDADLQEAYSFSDVGLINHWRNLFEDRRERIAAMCDAETIGYVDEDNYSELAERLIKAGFKGWTPDLDDLHLGAKAFDEHGFAKDGSHWVAFNYKPLPSTFWPTNGSTDDVMIRLPAAFRESESGVYSRAIYQANLSILEATIKGVDKIGCPPIDECDVGVDLDDDGALGVARRVSRVDGYVGAASDVFIDRHLYPEGTEFLHSVRYLGIEANGTVTHSVRLKELRYLKKWKAYSKPIYTRRYQLEAFEKQAGNLPGYQNLGDHGLDNGNGWSVQGFIEDRRGRLRANTYEETLFCMGCHNSIGTTIDKTFAFPRKVDGAAGWKYIDLRGLPDAPSRGEQEGEILLYLERSGGGSEFRSNDEMRERWYAKDGSVDREKVEKSDVYELITPSPERALLLNKAYRAIVQDQDFMFGRDATIEPPAEVFERIDPESAPTLPPERRFAYDLILDWEAVTE